jgi:hypothetical protein
MPRNPSLQHVEDKATDDAVPQSTNHTGRQGKANDRNVIRDSALDGWI